jgi:hypothetical protein
MAVDLTDLSFIAFFDFTLFPRLPPSPRSTCDIVGECVLDHTLLIFHSQHQPLYKVNNQPQEPIHELETKDESISPTLLTRYFDSRFIL